MSEKPQMPEVCGLHSGNVEAMRGLGRSIDGIRHTHEKEMSDLKAEMQQTNQWLQKITLKALERWSPGQVKAFICLSGLAGILLSGVIALVIALSKHF